jgi:hypothetical protein
MRAGHVAVPQHQAVAGDSGIWLQDADVVLAFTDGARRAALASHVPVIDFDDAGPGGFAARIAPAEFKHTPCARRCGADALHLRLHRQA